MEKNLGLTKSAPAQFTARHHVMLVAGGSGGLGTSVMKLYNDRGYHVVNIDFDVTMPVTLDQKCLDCDLPNYISVDLTHWDELAASLLELGYLKNAFVSVVNCVSSRKTSDFLDTSENEWHHEIDANLKVAFRLTQVIMNWIQLSENTSAAICHVSSTLATHVGLQSGMYHIAKAGIEHLVRFSAVEAGRVAIPVRCNGVAPGFIVKDSDLEYFSAAGNRSYAKLVEQLHPNGRWGTTADVAQAIFWVNDPDNSYLNGSIVQLDGGLSLHETFSSHVIHKED
jgi:3-oxoacyl-[acyl-carrier protein] reductase